MKMISWMVLGVWAVSLTLADAQPVAPVAAVAATNVVAAGPRTNFAILPAPRPQESAVKRYELLNERVKTNAGRAELVFLGDSITQGWEGNGKNVWQRYYGGRQALNLGIGGDRTQHVLWRMEHGNFEGLHPKVIVLMIGTNNSNKEDHPPGEILEGVQAIVSEIRKRLPETKILLVGIFPRGQTFSDQRGKILQVNQALAKLEDGKSVHYVDFGSQLIEADGSIAKAVMPDYLHLSERGYELWAAAIEPKLAVLLGDQPVTASAGGANPSGEWTWTMKGPQGEDVGGPLTLKVAEGKVSGEFRADNDRTLKITEGTLSGSTLKLTVVRNRPQGGEMTYDLTATVNGNVIEGSVEADMGGQKVTMPWSARRK